MKVIQIVPSIAAESSGPSYSVPALCQGLTSAGCEVSLHFLDDVPPQLSHVSYQVTSYPRCELGLKNLGRSPAMLAGLLEAAHTSDIIHNNSLWMMPNVYPSWVVRCLRRKNLTPSLKLVTAPRGTLASWSLAKGKWKKRIFGALFQYPALRLTDMFHATSEKEYEEIRALGYRQPVAIVPIGMDIPEEDVFNAEAQRRREVEERRKRVVFFGRLHKVKGVDRLVRAWERVARDGWELVIAGPDCGMLEELKGLVAERRLPRVSFVGEINGQAKYEFLANSDIYVLPSDTENFGVTVTEALASGTPVIASQGTPWQGLVRERCGRWVPVGVEPLAAALDELMSMSDEERVAMGERGHMWIRRDFSWNGIGGKMRAAYEWLLGSDDRPGWVKID